MEHLWTPWRFGYIVGTERTPGCPFCVLPKETDDRKNLIVYRGEHNFIILNLFPYTNGHLMVVPFLHEASLKNLDEATTAEGMELTKWALRAMEEEYRPEGFNIGWNLGRTAGAGVADHLHQHIVPRWLGDSSFLTVIGETRILPEDLYETYDKLVKYFKTP